MNCLVFGAGYVGAKLAAKMAEAGHGIHCLTAGKQTAKLLSDRALSTSECNLDLDDATLPRFHPDVAVYLVPPPPKGRVDTRSRKAAQLLSKTDVQHLVLVSTTGVYGDCEGQWVDETRPLNPTADRSWRRVDSEAIWRAWAIEHGCRLSVLRVAGIYAADKLPIKRLSDGLPVLAADISPWSNRIHTDDLVDACSLAAEQRVAGIFNVADDEPTTMTDYFFKVADAKGIPRPPQVSMREAEQSFSERLLSYLRESRRIDNSKIKQALAWELRYPTLKEGLAEVKP